MRWCTSWVLGRNRSGAGVAVHLRMRRLDHRSLTGSTCCLDAVVEASERRLVVAVELPFSDEFSYRPEC